MIVFQVLLNYENVSEPTKLKQKCNLREYVCVCSSRTGVNSCLYVNFGHETEEMENLVSGKSSSTLAR